MPNDLYLFNKKSHENFIKEIPVIIKIKEKSIQDYEKSLTILVALVFWAGIVISLIMIFLGEWLIIVTFGPDYIEAKNVLQVCKEHKIKKIVVASSAAVYGESEPKIKLTEIFP